MAAAKPREVAERAWEQSERVVRDFFEPQLRALGLTVNLIKEQNLEQLEASLNRVNEAIANPDSLGKIRLLYVPGVVTRATPVQGRRSRSRATARRAALDAVAAIRTIEAEEDGAQRSHASESSGPALLSVRDGAGSAGRGAAGAALNLHG